MEVRVGKEMAKRKIVNVSSQKKIDRGTMQGQEPDEKNAIHHPMDRKANWCSGGLLVQSGQ
jgi:hypothetical protein